MGEGQGERYRRKVIGSRNFSARPQRRLCSPLPLCRPDTGV